MNCIVLLFLVFIMLLYVHFLDQNYENVGEENEHSGDGDTGKIQADAVM